jgi:hypothetical protein
MFRGTVTPKARPPQGVNVHKRANVRCHQQLRHQCQTFETGVKRLAVRQATEKPPPPLSITEASAGPSWPHPAQDTKFADIAWNLLPHLRLRGPEPTANTLNAMPE